MCFSHLSYVCRILTGSIIIVSPKPGDSDEEGYNEEGDEVSTASEGDSSEAEGSTSEDGTSTTEYKSQCIYIYISP